MTPSLRTAMRWWAAGLLAFGIVIAVSLPLSIDAVPRGIIDHQRAGDAAVVDTIQLAWKAAGLLTLARIAMVADLIFIGIFGVGCVLAGLHYRARPQVVLRVLGWCTIVSGLIFLASDYGETIAQVIEVMRFKGDDDLAALAATLRPVKEVSWIAAFLAILAALGVDRFSTSAA